MKRLFAILFVLGALSGCGDNSSFKPECPLHQDRLPTFDIAEINVSDKVSRFAIYSSRVSLFTGEMLDYFHFAGDSLVTFANRNRVNQMDSSTGRFPYWDSLAAHGVFFDINPVASWVRAPGQMPVTRSTLVIYAEFEDAGLDHTLIDAMHPINSETEAWLCAETLLDQWILWSEEDLGQSIERTNQGEFNFSLPYFIGLCDNQEIGILRFSLSQDGEITSQRDEGRVYSKRCKCWEPAP